MRKLQLLSFFVAYTTLSFPDICLAQRPNDPRPVEGKGDGRAGVFSEPAAISKAIARFDRYTAGQGPPKDGFFLETGKMIAGAGWFAAGPGYRQHVFGDRAIASVSGAMSVRFYTVAKGTLEFPRIGSDHVSASLNTLFQDALQVNYFGLGNDSSPANRSGYRLRSNDLAATVTIGGPQLSLSSTVGWLRPIDVSTMAGRRPGYPDTLQIFDERTAPGLMTRPSFGHADLSLATDTRDYPGHPTAGAFYRGTWTAYSDQKGVQSSFQRFEIEGAQYLPLRSQRIVLALKGSGAFSSGADSNRIPFYLMPNLGGRNARAYPDYRFHDRNMHAYSAESRLALFRHVDAVLFMDAGSVAPTIARLGRSALKTSLGTGIRLHNHRQTIARLDVAHGAEGWNIVFKLSDPFRRSTQLSGRPPVIPFVP